MWLFGLKQQKRNDTRVIFDIGSGSVGGAIVSQASNSVKPTIHFTVRTPISLNEQFAYPRFRKATLDALRTTAEQTRVFLAKEKRALSLGEVACVLSSPWYASRTISLSKVEDREFTVSSNLIQELLDTRGVAVDEEEQAMLKQKQIEQPAIFERRILNISLNGYKTGQPIGKKASRLEVDMFAAVLELSFYQELQLALASAFEGMEIALHTHTLSMFTTVRDCFGTQGDFLLVDVGGEVTDITFALDDVIHGSATVPVGAYTIADTLAAKKNTTRHEALSLMTLVSEKEQTLSAESAEYTALTNAGNEWWKACCERIAHMAGGGGYPRDVFITAPHETVGWFKRIIAESGNTESGTPQFDVTPFIDCLTEHFVETDKGMALDPMLAIEALHVLRT